MKLVSTMGLNLPKKKSSGRPFENLKFASRMLCPKNTVHVRILDSFQFPFGFSSKIFPVNFFRFNELIRLKRIFIFKNHRCSLHVQRSCNLESNASIKIPSCHPTQNRDTLALLFMKTDIHPKYIDAEIRCACGNVIKTRSTKPTIIVGICNVCHPFYTGTQKFVDTAGRVDKFQQRAAKTQAAQVAFEATKKKKK
jgi:large subunit ribosomal protein L31